MGVISVLNIGKAYKQYPSRISRLVEWLDPRGKSRHSLHWVLRDVSFVVNKGEAVGVIGINGAGKSTLLKIITGTTAPTFGSINIEGRVAALLELGMGFHPDFTGRQNVLLSGQLIGYSESEIAELMPSIEEFAELGEYIDQPVRVYSSGMQVRLAFSVATAVRPAVLIIDEALSVGDAYFQHKSFARIREFKEQGTTLLLVSHDKQAIQAICDRAILLNAGRLEIQGEPEKVLDYYNALLVGDRDQMLNQEIGLSGRTTTTSGSRQATITNVVLKDEAGNNLAVVSVGQRIEIHITVVANQDLSSLVVGCAIKDRLGQLIFGTNTESCKQVLYRVPEGDEYLFIFSCAACLGVGSYALTVAAQASNPVVDGKYHWIDNTMIFEVVNIDKPNFAGVSWTDMDFEVRKLGGV